MRNIHVENTRGCFFFDTYQLPPNSAIAHMFFLRGLALFVVAMAPVFWRENLNYAEFTPTNYAGFVQQRSSVPKICHNRLRGDLSCHRMDGLIPLNSNRFQQTRQM